VDDGYGPSGNLDANLDSGDIRRGPDAIRDRIRRDVPVPNHVPDDPDERAASDDLGDLVFPDVLLLEDDPDDLDALLLEDAVDGQVVLRPEVDPDVPDALRPEDVVVVPAVHLEDDPVFPDARRPADGPAGRRALAEEELNP
jgi:hypothetical protein